VVENGKLPTRPWSRDGYVSEIDSGRFSPR